MIAKKAKFRLLDALLIALCAGVVIYLGYRIQVRLQYSWNWRVIPRYLLRMDAQNRRLVANYLLLGLFTTIKLSIWSTILAMIIGVVMGIFRTGKRLFFRMIGTA